MKCKVNVGPRIQKIFAKNAKRAREYQANRSSNYVFEVSGRKGSILQSQHSVDLAKKMCTCRRWMMSEIPCPHVIACIFVRGQDPVDYVDDYYSKQSYLNAYAHSINPVPGIDLWPMIDAPIQPPPFRRQRGRQKMVRRREEGEEPAAANISTDEVGCTKMPRSRYVTMSCTSCGSKYHNRRTCQTELAKKTRNAFEVSLTCSYSLGCVLSSEHMVVKMLQGQQKLLKQTMLVVKMKNQLL
ncbi:hypothetical protein M0R45_016330 [Rubus argutus]|uniref:SWIM-type domain-containing protein n=1 Tax=Rubus argutus TaxID=59490 RepID=A0AAW1XUA3_RUBAR